MSTPSPQPATSEQGDDGAPRRDDVEQGEPSHAHSPGNAPIDAAYGSDHSEKTTPDPQPLIKRSRSGRVINRPRYLMEYDTASDEDMASAVTQEREVPAIIAVCGDQRIRLTSRKTKRWMKTLREWEAKDLPIAFLDPTGEPRLQRLRARIQPEASAWRYSQSQGAKVFVRGCGQPLFLRGGV